ncbi:hypothetical protein H9P43_000332 [Blastocladiella emersonii ATCC 22665]|nr:hypothetical protein H9P43_000332 [Blastocladiella emersonii ATCC 22665]
MMSTTPSSSFDSTPSSPDRYAKVPQRRRSSASSTASLTALASAATYSQQEIYSFLLVSKELAAAADFICQLLELGGLNDDILLSEFKTILVDLMSERFSEIWDIRAPKKGAGFRTISHAPNLPNQHVDPILHQAFVACNIHPKHLATLLPVSFSLTINPGLVAYTTSDVEGFQPVHLFEARPYLPPKHQEPVDHGAEIRLRALRSVELGHAKLDDFDVDSYFGGRSGVPARRPSLPPSPATSLLSGGAGATVSSQTGRLH